MAIESDGTARYRSMSVRERSRLRPQLLERLGWRYMPLWTIEVFTDPAACADLVGRYLGLPASDPEPEPIREALRGASTRHGGSARQHADPSAGRGTTQPGHPRRGSSCGSGRRNRQSSMSEEQNSPSDALG